MLEVFAVVFSKSGMTLVNCLELKEKKNNVTKIVVLTRVKKFDFPIHERFNNA